MQLSNLFKPKRFCEEFKDRLGGLACTLQGTKDNASVNFYHLYKDGQNIHFKMNKDEYKMFRKLIKSVRPGINVYSDYSYHNIYGNPIDISINWTGEKIVINFTFVSIGCTYNNLNFHLGEMEWYSLSNMIIENCK